MSVYHNFILLVGEGNVSSTLIPSLDTVYSILPNKSLYQQFAKLPNSQAVDQDVDNFISFLKEAGISLTERRGEVYFYRLNPKLDFRPAVIKDQGIINPVVKAIEAGIIIKIPDPSDPTIFSYYLFGHIIISHGNYLKRFYYYGINPLIPTVMTGGTDLLYSMETLVFPYGVTNPVANQVGRGFLNLHLNIGANTHVIIRHTITFPTFVNPTRF